MDETLFQISEDVKNFAVIYLVRLRLLALPYLVGADRARRDPLLVGWLGAFFVACLAMGLLLELNSYGELYLILMMRLPLSVLTAGFLVAAWRRAAVWRAGRGPVWTQRPAVTRGLLATGTLALALTVGLQGSLWWRRNLPGLGEWAHHFRGFVIPLFSLQSGNTWFA